MENLKMKALWRYLEGVLEALRNIVGAENVIEAYFSSFFHYSLTDGKIYVDIIIRWQAKTNFNVCSEQLWRRWACRLAHGNECGSGKYTEIKNRTMEAYSNILNRFGIEFPSRHYLTSDGSVNRKRSFFWVVSRGEISDNLLSPQLLEVKNSILSKTAAIEGRVNNKEMPLFFGNFPELFAGEIGNVDVKDVVITAK